MKKHAKFNILVCVFAFAAVLAFYGPAWACCGDGHLNVGAGEECDPGNPPEIAAVPCADPAATCEADCTCTPLEEPGACWFTGGGAKFEPLDGMYMAQRNEKGGGPRDSFGGNVAPSCSLEPGDGGQWNHIAHSLKMHFQGWTVDEVTCGNVPEEIHEPGSESPVTPYNYIEFKGTGTLKGIKGNKADYPDMVYFFARCEDRNEPGNETASGGEDVDRYFLHVFADPDNPVESTLLLIDVDGNPETVDPITITKGNFQLHISSCDN